jgi:peptide/nickel transport system substrate-binding protein
MQKVWPVDLRRALAALAGCALLAASCAPGPAGSVTPSDPMANPVTNSTAPAPASAPKTIRLVMPASAEQKGGFGLFGGTGIYTSEHQQAFHAGLTNHDADLNLTAKLAERIPTVENGDLQLRPDGSMEVTWRLRPGVTWHDGTPLTAEDFVFGYTLRMDRELPIAAPFPTNLVSEVMARDPQTLIVQWRQPYFLANESLYADLVATPRHLLQTLYEQGDRQSFTNSLYWTREFVGLGPYKVGPWESGSTLEGLAFDRYFLGKPKIDRVIFQYIGSPEAEIASLLGGGSDVAPIGSGLTVDGMIQVKNAWERSGQGTVMAVPAGVWFMHLQSRDKTLPWAGDATVRRALVHAIDRQSNTEALQSGVTPVADTFVTVEDPSYRLLEQRGLARYAYDPARARQLLAEAGWRPGPDGALQKEGQRFAFSLLAPPTVGGPEEAQVIGSQLTSIGIAVSIVPFNTAAGGAAELVARNPGGRSSPWVFGPTSIRTFTSAQIPTEENRWVGSNVGGYSNPTVDQLYQRYQATLPAAERAGLAADLLKIIADDVAAIPLYYRVLPVMFRNGIRGPGKAPTLDRQQTSTWNIHTWEMD